MYLLTLIPILNLPIVFINIYNFPVKISKWRSRIQIPTGMPNTHGIPTFEGGLEILTGNIGLRSETGSVGPVSVPF